MRKPITPFAHGIIDYLTVGTVAAAPKLMDLPDEASNACYTLAALYAGTSMMTDYPLGVRRALPFKAHGFAEVAIGAMLPALPFVLGFAGNRRARNFFLGLTVLTAMTAAMTDWDKKSERLARRRHKRKPRLVSRAA